jgi:hypothetical protein
MSHAVAKVLRGMAFDWIVGAAAVVVALSVQALLTSGEV